MNTTSCSESSSSANSTKKGFGSIRRSMRRQTVAYGVTGGILFAALIGGGAAWASTPVQTGTSTAVPASASTTTSTHTRYSTDHAHKKHEIVGVLTGVAGSSWKIRTHDHKVLTLTITDSTAFGSAKKHATVASFVVGDRVMVSGHRDGSTVEARRILHAHRVHKHDASSSAASAAA